MTALRGLQVKLGGGAPPERLPVPQAAFGEQGSDLLHRLRWKIILEVHEPLPGTALGGIVVAGTDGRKQSAGRGVRDTHNEVRFCGRPVSIRAVGAALTSYIPEAVRKCFTWAPERNTGVNQLRLFTGETENPEAGGLGCGRNPKGCERYPNAGSRT